MSEIRCIAVKEQLFGLYIDLARHPASFARLIQGSPACPGRTRSVLRRKWDVCAGEQASSMVMECRLRDVEARCYSRVAWC
jgi:hypothetical protein